MLFAMNNKNTVCFETLPKKKEILAVVDEVQNYLHPDYFERMKTSKEKYRAKKLKKIRKLYNKYICPNTADEFIQSLGELEANLKADLDFFMESDPAISSIEEVVISYPGYLAITLYRIAHIIYDLGVQYVPRIITEAAHSKTGVDIHPAAVIGVPFFIDHGTGIVIGETAEIGSYVKIYHGVTLGALSLSDGAKLRGTKRHPTIKNHVTIYAGASILGGETIIEDNVTIGSNVFIVNSVIKDTTVVYSQNNIKK